MVEYVLRFADRDEIRIADQDGHEVGDAIAIGGHDWIVESIRVPEGTVPERIALRLVSPSRDRIAPADNDHTLLREITERVNDSRDGFTIVMTVSEWIDAQLWPASERAAGAEE
jgi:hypothetical protein